MLPLLFACLIAFIIIMYVILDGFDLGIGMLFPFTENEEDRDQMMNSVAPVWDGNETWLVFGAAMLYGAFPLAYGLLLPSLYMPIMLMLIALIFRGVCFEFRFKAETSKPLWNWFFSISSIAAAFFQGVILGCFIQGFPVSEAAATLSKADWLTPFTFLTGVALICGYSLLGATWMLMRCEGRLQEKMIHSAKGLLIIVSFFLIVITIWTPLHSPEIYERWYRFPNMLLLSPFPIITLVAIILAWRNLEKANEIKPFIYSILVFICSYIGIAVSVYPYLVPRQVTLWDAVAPDSTLRFILVGVIIALPVLIGYTIYSYYLFWGKNHEGYH